MHPQNWMDPRSRHRNLHYFVVRRAAPDEAEVALRHHLRMVLSAVPSIRAQHPEYFEEEGES